MEFSLFGAPPLSLTDFEKMNDQIKPVSYYGIPIILGLAILEMYLDWKGRKADRNFTPKENLISFVVGFGYLISSYLTKALLFGMIVWFYNLLPWRMELNWWLFIPCYLIHDFSSYFRHRITHESRFWWAIHIPHHSANQYNLWINFRQSWFEQLSVVFYIPMLCMGFHPVLYFVVHQLNAILQFWVHTEYIGKLPRWFEYVFVTPSSHKLHHASNVQYLDKNFGNTFLIWDRLFGTHAELEEKPRYGLTQPLESNKVLDIVFHEVIEIYRDVKAAKTWKEKWRMMFGSPIAIAEEKKIKALLAYKDVQPLNR